MLILKFGYNLNIKIFCEQNKSEFILKRGIYKVFDKYISAFCDEMEVMREETYLLGAADREQMLK